MAMDIGYFFFVKYFGCGSSVGRESPKQQFPVWSQKGSDLGRGGADEGLVGKWGADIAGVKARGSVRIRTDMVSFGIQYTVSTTVYIYCIGIPIISLNNIS